MPEFVSVRQFADRAGVTLRAVQVAIQNGRIAIDHTELKGKTKKPYHFINYETEIQKWIEFRDESRKGRPTRREMGKGKQPTYKTPDDRDPVDTAPPEIIENKSAGSYHKARAVRELFNAKTAELDYKVRTGELVNLEKAKEIFINTGLQIKQNLLNIPNRLAPILASISDERKCNELLTDELRNALTALSEAEFQIDD